MENNLDALIGAEIISIDNNKIVIKKNEKQFILTLDEDYGDCCGYNDIKTKLLINDNSKAIITKIEKIQEEDGCSSTCKITFFGEYKPIAEIETLSSSDSGCAYGACVSLICDALEINEMLSDW